MTSSFSIWACILEGCFGRVSSERAKSCVKGIEKFDLEHWKEGGGIIGKQTSVV